jgi:hypothetical protein
MCLKERIVLALSRQLSFNIGIEPGLAGLPVLEKLVVAQACGLGAKSQ